MPEQFPDLIVDAALAAGCRHVLACVGTSIIAIDFYTVLAAPLPATDDRQEVLAAVDALLSDVLALRRTWAAARSSDLYLMLAAPQGSADQPVWKSWAAEIERDDRLARKHVWLPDNEGGNFGSFIETTFLARPWGAAEGRVDALKLLTEQVAVPTGWQQLLFDGELQGDELIRKLMDLDMEQTQ
jgi:hypothetical protein